MSFIHRPIEDLLLSRFIYNLTSNKEEIKIYFIRDWISLVY